MCEGGDTETIKRAKASLQDEHLTHGNSDKVKSGKRDTSEKEECEKDNSLQRKSGKGTL